MSGPTAASGPVPAPSGLLTRTIALVRSGHPGPCLAITTITVLLAVAARASAGSASPHIGVVVAFAFAVLAGQFSIGWSNDYLDARRDRAAGRTDKPLAVGALRTTTVLACALIALLISFGLGLAIGPVTAAWLVPVVGAGWAYNAGLKATVLSGLAYVVGFGPIPGLATSILPGHPLPRPWALAAASLLGLGAHFVNVLPDLATDRAAGLRGLPHVVAATATRGNDGAAGQRRVRLVALALLLAASALIAVAPGVPHVAAPARWFAWAGFGAAVLLCGVASRASGRTPFRCALAIAGIDVLMFCLAGGALT
ncbi:MAG TPA: UbiA family prenyltransferase [Micromonosporaceae bacterium]|jgi:4-hydroxybenzoate polyprenyltransferase